MSVPQPRHERRSQACSVTTVVTDSTECRLVDNTLRFFFWKSETSLSEWTPMRTCVIFGEFRV